MPSTVARGGRWRVEVPDPVANRVTRDALDGAWALFAGVRCRSVLTEFVTGVVAFTTPDSRVVRLCTGELKRTWQQNPTHVVAAFIHEMLHTLGLGENPPSPKEITRRVLGLCRNK